MVNRADIRTLNEQTRAVMEALDELEELADADENPAVTVDPGAYGDAQERVKNAVAELVNQSDDMVERTDVLEDDEGNPRVELPNAALARDGNATTMPANAGGNADE